MKVRETSWSGGFITGAIGVAVLSMVALSLPKAQSPERITTHHHAFVLPASAGISRTFLPDGRLLEMHGGKGVAYIISGNKRFFMKLPEVRRFGSVTVMPGGEVLLWGGVDEQGRVLDNGEWFNPATQHFVRTGALGLPVRAGHTLTVLTDGSVLMTGGWSTDGEPATTAVVWHPQTRISTVLSEIVSPRMEANASLQGDGSVAIEGGVDERGLPIYGAWQYDPTTSRLSTVVTSPAKPASIIAETSPGKDSTSASIHGPLVMRFATPVALHQLNDGAVTLLGPEGAVPVKVVGAEGGRLAFVQLPDDLYPGSRYTLFVKGLHTTAGDTVPYTAMGFTTASHDATGVVLAGQGARPAANIPASSESSLPPLYVMAGDGHASCAGDQLCRTHGFVRDGAFYPGQNNAPDNTGAHWRLYAKYQHLPDTRTREAAIPKGSTALIGQVRQIDETPVANVEVSVGDQKVTTDAQGVFVLKDLPAGRDELFVDGGSASHGDVTYGRFVVGADVKAKAISHMPFVMYLPRILPRDEITLPTPTTREVVLTHPDMPGLELHVPAGAVFKDRSGHVLTHIALVPTPVDHAPFPLPDNFPMYFTIQPGDAVVQGLTPEAAKGIRVVYPNYGKAKASTAADFWVYSAKDGWQMYGAGHVTPDTKHLAPDPGVTLTLALGAGASMNNVARGTGQKICNARRAKPIDLQTGIMFHEWDDLTIRDIVPLALTRTYSSASTASQMFGIGGNSNFGMHLAGTTTNNGYTFNTVQLVLPCGEGVDFNLVSGSATWPFPAGTVWEHTGSDSSYYGATMQFLYDNTAIGAHWIVTMKDGTQYAFTRHVPNSLSWIQDRYGNQLQFTYNGGLLEQLISPSGRTITFNYDSGNRVTSAVDNSGRTITYVYNSAGTLTTVTYPDQTTEQYTYDGNNRMTTMRDRRGHVWVTNQYDTNGRVAKQTYADNTAYQFAYTMDSNNKVTATTVTDPNGNQEQVAFDPVSGYPSSDTLAYGTSLAQTTTYKREASGLVDSETDALGRTTAYTYDALGNVTSVTRLSGTSNEVTTRSTYTSDYNQVASVTDPLGHTTNFGYTNGCLTQITDALGHSTTIQCNAAGQRTTVQDALGNTTTFAYQGYDLQSVTDPLSRTTSYVVDALGRRIAKRDALGNVTLTQYDTNDHVVSTTDALNQTTTQSYDGNGNLLSVTLPNTGVIHYVYDNRNRLITRTDAMNQSESWTYDGMGNVLTHTDRKGQITDTSYDALNRKNLVSYADGSGIQASYDAGDRLASLTDSIKGTLSWGYDGLDRLTGASSPQGNISYTYDAAGRRTSMTAAAQAIASYTYDNANRLTAITQGSETVQLAYDSDNRRSTLTLPNGITVAYGYDTASELTGLTYTQSNGTTLGNLAYGYDGDGRIISKSGTFATDVLPTATTQPATFDLNDRKTSFNGQALSYDANGNLTNDGTNTYTWNARNQLTQVSQGGMARLSYTYDALGRRTSKAVQGGTPTQYLYDRFNAVQETQGSTINPILVGLGIDEHFARSDVTGRTYFLTDQINSTIALTDPNGALKQQYSYDPYGNVRLSDTTTGFTNPYQFTGREADTPGLYYYRARYYSPLFLGFISEDPITFGGGQLSFYAYVGGNPVNSVDPTGRDIFVAHTSQVGRLHEKIVVGKPYGEQYGQSYGMNSRDDPEQWSQSNGPTPGGEGSGEVYEDEDPITSLVEGGFYLQTTPEEDAAAITYLKLQLGNTGPYNIIGDSCRTYSERQYANLLLLIMHMRYQ
ncbi:RHS repeat-associated core domain protein [Burkholderia thailandensis MSMB121]|nr:RHS repeat-associated core domain-containing protein [Burkholderia humptydooensis]AGK48115.1 RHS repeat-associated core domain protein [Burkholderia thailandensis MSMB121]ATF37770.1 Rhs family protein [Burkholderia thailandensis]KST76053.1 Rhs family protein [Burkholderia humptydooensis]